MIIIIIHMLIIMYKQITPTFEPGTAYENYLQKHNIKRYKLRGEVFGDVCEFHNLLTKTGNSVVEIKIEPMYLSGIPITDFTMEFCTDMNIESIKKLLRRGRDLHIMERTVKPIELYDGEYNF